MNITNKTSVQIGEGDKKMKTIAEETRRTFADIKHYVKKETWIYFYTFLELKTKEQ